MNHFSSDIGNNWVWHFLAHKALKRRLRYVPVKMSSNHDKENLFDSFKKFCEIASISSYGIYEIYGSQDFILKFWIDADKFTIFQEDFLDWAESIGNKMHIDSHYAIDLETVHFHWLWDQSPEKSEPELDDLDILVKNTGHSEDNSAGDQETFENRHLLKLKEKADPGIRFLTTVTKPNANMPDDSKLRHINKIAEILLKSDKILNAELYAGDAKEWLYIDARVNLSDYDAIYTFINAIKETGLKDFGCSTTTYLCATSDGAFLEYDSINSPSPEEPEFDENRIVELLNEDEGTNLEIKGSLRISVEDYLKDNVIKKIDALEKKVLHAIAGFMNTNGGVVIIGAIEPSRFKEEDIEDLPLIGKYKVCGIDPNLQKNDDTFERTMIQLIRSRIGSRVSSLVKLKTVEVKGKIICGIQVPKITPELQYLDDEHVIVREGSMSRPLNSKEVAELVASRNRQ